MQTEKLLKCVLDLGEQMLICGAEISRVEDTIKRVTAAYGCPGTDVFVITSVIFLSLENEDGTCVTGNRRVTKYDTNLDKLHAYNDLSRKICRTLPDESDVEEEIAKIKAQKPYHLPVGCAIYALTAGSFAVFFGGGWRDAIAAAVIGAIIRIIVYFQSKTKVNMVFNNVVSSAVLTLLAFLTVKIWPDCETSKIIIGGIMLLIPGVALTNSIRDVISGDIVSGMLRFAEAMIIALAIAAGYILVSVVFGGGAI